MESLSRPRIRGRRGAGDASRGGLAARGAGWQLEARGYGSGGRDVPVESEPVVRVESALDRSEARERLGFEGGGDAPSRLVQLRVVQVPTAPEGPRLEGRGRGARPGDLV